MESGNLFRESGAEKSGRAVGGRGERLERAVQLRPLRGRLLPRSAPAGKGKYLRRSYEQPAIQPSI